MEKDLLDCTYEFVYEFFTGKTLVKDDKGLPIHRNIEEAYMADAKPGCHLAIVTYEGNKCITHLFQSDDPIEVIE